MNKKMKRLTAVFLVVLMSMTLVGCAKRTDVKTGDELC